MGVWISAASTVASLFISLIWPLKTWLNRLVIFALGLFGALVALNGNLEKDALLDKLDEPRRLPLTADQVSMIVPSVAGTRPAQPIMTIYYLDKDALDLARSFKELFSEIGFKPKIQPDGRMPPGDGTIKIDADDSDKEMLKIIIKRMESVTESHIRCDLTSSKGQDQTIIRIGQKMGF